MDSSVKTLEEREILDSLSSLQNISDKAHRNALLSFGDVAFKAVTRGPGMRLSFVHKNGILKTRAKAIYVGRVIGECDRSKVVFRKQQEQAPARIFFRELKHLEDKREVYASTLYSCLIEVSRHVVETRDGEIEIEFTDSEGFQIVESKEI